MTWFLTAIALFLAGNLVFTACIKDFEFPMGNTSRDYDKIDNDLKITDLQGRHWTINLERNGKQLTYRAERKLGPKNKQTYPRFINAVADENMKDKETILYPGKIYWFISADGTSTKKIIVDNPTNFGYDCFCESPCVTESSNCDLVTQGLSDSITGYSCQGGCSACDMRFCPDTKVINSKFFPDAGVLVEAESLIIDIPALNNQTNRFFGGNTQIDIVFENSNIIAKRYLLSNEATYIRKVIDMRSGKPFTKNIQSKEYNYWFIPFQIGADPIVLEESGPSCVSKTCEGDSNCSLADAGGGCLECKCEIANGDCDMVAGVYTLNGIGGIIVSSRQVIIKDFSDAKD